MSSEDDDVLFEGHALQKYLDELGFHEYETATLPSATPLVYPKVEQEQITPRNSSLNMLGSFIHSTWNWLRKPWTGSMKSMDNATMREHVQIILESGLLFDDDAHFIQSVTSDIRKERCTSKKSLRLGMKGAVYESLIDVQQYFFSMWNMTVLPVTGSVLMCIVWNWKKMYENRQRLMQQRALLKSMQDLYITLWKSLKLLQENELILRGFTLARTGSTASRLENSDLPCMVRKWHSSPGLRWAVAKTIMDAVPILTCGTQHLISRCSVFGQFDNSRPYLSYLDDMASGIVPQGSSHEMDDSDQEVKLNHLKRLHHVFLLLQSEFLRSLALCFCPDVWRENSLTHVNETSSHVTSKFCELQTILENEYKMFFCYGVEKNIQEHSQIPLQRVIRSQPADIHMVIRSTGLHLQAILLSTRALEEKLENKESITENLSEVESHFIDLIQELDMCKSCCEEGIMQIKKLSSVPEPQIVQKESEKENDIGMQSPILIPVGYTDLDPPGVDEIFEAEISQDTSDDFYDDDQRIVIRKEEEERARQLSKKMLQELKSVLAEKAEKWKEREMKALTTKLDRDEGPRNKDEHGRIQKLDRDTRNSTASLSGESCTRAACLSPNVEPKRAQSSCSLHGRSSQDGDSSGGCRKVHSTDSSESNTSSPQLKSNRSPKHLYASETFRPLHNDLQFSVGLYLSNEALAKFQARDTGSSDTFSGIGEKSSSEESLHE